MRPEPECCEHARLVISVMVACGQILSKFIQCDAKAVDSSHDILCDLVFPVGGGFLGVVIFKWGQQVTISVLV